MMRCVYPFARSDDFGYLSDDKSKEVAIMAKKIRRLFLAGIAESVMRAEEAKARLKNAALSAPEDVRDILGTAEDGLTHAQAEQMRQMMKKYLITHKMTAL